MQQAHRSSARTAPPTTDVARAPAVRPFGERGNQARLEQMGDRRAGVGQRLGLLDHAAGSFGDLDEADAARLAELNERLAAARERLAEGDPAALMEEVAALDREYGQLVADTGTIIDMAPTQPSDAPPGAFDGVDSFYVNGMTNTLTSSMRAAGELANIRGTDVGLVYNATGGTARDLRESVAQRAAGMIPFWDSRTQEGATLAGAIQESLAAGRNVDVVSHSQGGLFAQEALERLGEDEAMRGTLDERVRLNLMGSAVEDDHLPGWFDNAMFIDENSDPVAREIGRRVGQGEERSWWEKLPWIGKDDTIADGMEYMQFESGEVGLEAHRAKTYLRNEQVRRQLATNTFDGQ